jgi:hypothetical protein
MLLEMARGHIADPVGVEEDDIARPIWLVDEEWPPAAHPSGGGPETSEIFVMNVNSGSQARLTSNRVADDSPTWSPDGRRIAFVRFNMCTVCPPTASGVSEILVVNADGTGLRRLTRNRIDDASPAWQPATPGR